MKFDQSQDFEAFVAQIVEPIIAGPRRKHDMREELLAHLYESHGQQLRNLGDEQAANDAAKSGLGSVADLRRELQASVPLFEKIWFGLVEQKENPMSRWIWAVAVIAIVAAMNFAFPYRDVVEFAGLTVLVGLVLRHLCQRDNLASRWLGRGWPWYVGIVAALFGTAIILPALAKLKQGGPLWSVIPAVIGTVIVLFGMGFIGYGFKSMRTRVA